MNNVIKTGINMSYHDAHSTSAQHFQRDRMVDSTRGSMPSTLTICLLLATVLAPVVKGDCTVVVNGANEPGPQAGGVVYTRWGRTVCPQGATLVYAGRAAGTKYNVKGGTSDTLCMPETPQYLSTDTTATHSPFGWSGVWNIWDVINTIQESSRGWHALCHLPHWHQTVCSHCPCSVHLSQRVEHGVQRLPYDRIRS